MVFDWQVPADDQEAPDPDRGPDLLGEVEPEDQLSARDEMVAVRQHLAKMNPDHVTAMLLHAQGYTLVEIAELTHVSAAAAQSRLSRGRRELRARLGRAPQRPTTAG